MSNLEDASGNRHSSISGSCTEAQNSTIGSELYLAAPPHKKLTQLKQRGRWDHEQICALDMLSLD
eukprot:1211851-Amphidinium_carterae.2